MRNSPRGHIPVLQTSATLPAAIFRLCRRARLSPRPYSGFAGERNAPPGPIPGLLGRASLPAAIFRLW
ncbi:MAG: hypothetical protein LBR86_07400, partial [Tannerella sp.]|nr:hypothetical protein [Tannerella sp.]